jgi:5-oxoprolinase (ATP-hydrolysing)
VRAWFGGAWHETPLFRREDTRPGDRIVGPAILAEAHATTIVEPGWQAGITAHGDLLMSRVQPLTRRRAIGTAVDPVMLEVFNNRFMSVAEQMGVSLQNTAYSVNIKERLDFSCAVFDGEGNLIANAPHMPVHLGSMGESVKTVMRANAGRMEPGDAYLINDPYHGGTHLPDMTVVSPVFGRAGRELLFFVGSRGHHADIGGITPGSMPPFSRAIEEEGIRFADFRLVEGGGPDRPGRLREAELTRLLTSGACPARNPAQNVADLRAQLAANERGRDELLRMVDEFGLAGVRSYMGHVQDNAEETVRRMITRLADGHFECRLDNGAVIRVRVTVHRERRGATIDFTGTSPQLPDNFNAPEAVCIAAVLYVFRTLVDDEIPLNAGCLRPLEIIVPPGSMLSPRHPAAVVAGNVETSTCIANALYGALGVMASAQGTMNNFTFGNERYQYYETIAGGSGAGLADLAGGTGFDGTDVVQTHMTNSRLTDPEVLEFRYPVRLESYAIRAGSGGAGRWRGGNGGTRRILFLERMTASILANNRSVPPFGLKGGASGAPGRNWVERADGTRTELGYIGSVTMEPGDVFVIETPGGGGYGAP